MARKTHIHWKDGKSHCGIKLQRHHFSVDSNDGTTCKNCTDLFQRRSSDPDEDWNFTLKYRVMAIVRSDGRHINIIIPTPRTKGKTIMQALGIQFEKKTGLRSKDCEKIWVGIYTNPVPPDFFIHQPKRIDV